MFGFKKKRSIEQLGEELKPTLALRDESKISALFDELISSRKTDPVKAEGYLGWGILVVCEFKLNCAGKYLEWFMDTYPESVIPVKMEYAEFMACTEKPDAATQLAREYLSLIKEKGSLSDSIDQFPNIQKGVSKAFIILTAAYTHVGARSYSSRIINYASRFPLDPTYLSHYRVELERLEEELQNQENRQVNALWESFFQTGQYANDLYELCKKKECEMLADRIELLEGNFRFLSNYRIDDDEMFMLIYEMKGEDGKMCRILR